jgi:ribosome-binding protein aMBF1 (putative translation factor)
VTRHLRAAASSAPTLPGDPSSVGSLVVRHVTQGEAGPALAKLANPRVLSVQRATVGEAMTAIRVHKLGLSRARLAVHMGMHEDTLRRYERDELQMDRAEVFRQMLLMCEVVNT